MHIAWGDYLSRVLVKPRARYRFFGFTLFGVAIGFLAPTRKASLVADTIPRLPGL